MNEINSICLLTFDYEMFLGKSGTIENCILKPTDRIIEILKKSEVKATFFVDTSFLLLLKINNHNKDLNRIKRQLLQLIESGHRIELHLHPHWLDATYESVSNQWIFNSYRYYMQKNISEEKLKELFHFGFDLLSEVAHEADRNYCPIAFRAGGWCLDPFERLYDLFIETGIWIDSSVLPKMKVTGNIASFDYSNIYHNKPYYFDNSVHSPKNHGLFLEVPLSITSFSPYQLFKRKIENFKNPNNIETFGDGKSIYNIKQQGNNWISEIIKKTYKTTLQVASLDGAPIKNSLDNITKHNSISVFVAHPKSMTQNSLTYLSYLIQKRELRFENIKEFSQKYISSKLV